MPASALLLPLALALASPAGPPAPAPPAGVRAERPALQPDSASVLRSARRAQQRFELIRRNNLTFTWPTGGGPCDERIGRFCLTYGSGKDEDDWTPPDEAVAVTRARGELIEVLDESAGLVPGDAWIAGQRVRYLLEAERLDDAVAAARACAAEAWWCLALRGYALHLRGETLAAEAAFDSALAVLPERERRGWTDLGMLLADGEYRRLRRAEPREREALERRLWWLADPLWMRPGNERRAEHYARIVQDHLQDRARTTEGHSWGDDVRQILLRYGSPVGWRRVREAGHLLASQPPGVITYYSSRGRHFVPPLAVAADPSSLTPESWPLQARASRTSYTAPYVYRFRPETPDHQVAVFRRGDSIVVVAAMSLPHDTLSHGRTVEAALVLAEDADTPTTTVRGTAADERVVLHAVAPARTTLLSAEAVVEDAWAARLRLALPVAPIAAGDVAISDLLLIAAEEPLPSTLEEARGAARASSRLRADEAFGVYWETYGLDERLLESGRVSVSIRRTDVGWLRRAAQRVGLLGAETPIRLRWEEQLELVDGVYARAVALRLPERAAPGAYAIELSLTLPGREPVTATRALRVEP